MNLTASWCDHLSRPDPMTGRAIDGEGGELLSGPVRLRAARASTVGFQVSAGPLAPGAAVSVRPGALSGPSGTRLGAGQFDVFVAFHHRLKDRWYPDALVPQELVGGSTAAFRRRSGRGFRPAFAGFWVDVTVPADARPGEYTGRLTVRCGRQSVDLPVVLEVAAARLPAEPALDMSFNNYADCICQAWPMLRSNPDRLWTDKYLRCERGLFRAAHEHRGFLHYLPYGHSGYVQEGFAPPLVGEGPKKRVADWRVWDRHFGPYFDGSAFRGTRRGAVPLRRFFLPLNLDWPADFAKFGEPGYEAEWRAVGRETVAHFRRKGWTGTHFDFFLNHKQRFRYFPWDGEECRFLPDNEIHRYLRKLWEDTYDRKSARPVSFKYTLGTTWTYGFDIRGDLPEFVDLYIASTDRFGPGWFPEYTPRIHRRGGEIWSCTSSGSILDSTRAALWPALLMWMRDVDGFMPRWQTASWGGDPWRAPADSGGTNFFYPGSEFDSEDTFPALRLKALRQSMQTVDLLQAGADRPGRGRRAVQARVNRLLGASPTGWHCKRPRKLDDVEPKDIAGTTDAVVEPPQVGWRKYGPELWRRLDGLALDLASGR